MKYGFMQAQSDVSIELMCELFSVSRSGYYAWLKKKLSQRDIKNTILDQPIKAIYMNHHQRYGAPRITIALKQQGILCSHTRVARRMQALGLKALAKRPYKVTTDSKHAQPVYDNVLDRDFSTTAVNQKWCGDITYIRTDEGWLYLAVIIDLHSRAVIGWSMNQRMNKQLVCDALLMALFKRKFPQGVIIHHDRGSQYCSKKYQQIIQYNQLTGSMSRRGNCWDNAVSESFFHSLKVELVHQHRYKNREQAKQSIFQYIEGYYNLKRMHSAIDYRTPDQVECA